MSFRKDKKSYVRRWEDRVEIKKWYFEWRTLLDIAEKLWYTYTAVEKYVHTKATKTYVDKDWKERRRCTKCNTYKTLDKYRPNAIRKNWNIYKASHCNYCDSILKRNKLILIKKDKIKYEKHLKMINISWHKHCWRYNTKRKINSILLKNNF